MRILTISGSNRRQYNCPGVDSKARTLMLRMAEHYEDLGNVYGRTRIQSCNACVSTSRPGKYRAFGYKPPGHFMRDVKLAQRDVRMRLGHPPEGSSPDEQQELGLNRDVTRHPAKSEGEKLREE